MCDLAAAAAAASATSAASAVGQRSPPSAGWLAGEVPGWLEAATACQLSNTSGSAPAARHAYTAAAGSGPADQVPLAEGSLLRDDVEDARRAEADPLPAEQEGLASAAAPPGQPSVQSDAVAGLPLGQALRQQAEVQGRTWAFETGKLARLAAGSCLVRVADTSVLAAATCQPPPWSRRDAQQLQFEVGGGGGGGRLHGCARVCGGGVQSSRALAIRAWI